MKPETIVGLDIGTTAVRAIVGERTEDGLVEIIGVGQAPSEGMRKGVVVNLEAVSRSIARAVEEAELMAGVEVRSVYCGIAGTHIRGLNSRGVIAVGRQEGEITPADVDRVIDAARAVSIPADREVIHVIPQEYIVDEQDGIKDPVGMSGIRLEAEVHIVTGAVTSAQNLVRAVNKAGFEVEDIVLEPLAAAYAVLTEQEKEMGVALVDMGGGTTDIAVFVEGSIWATEVLPIGGGNVTKDIAIGLRAPLADAEAIKIRAGAAEASCIKADEEVSIPTIGGRQPRSIPRGVLVEIVQPRMEETFMHLQRALAKTGYAELLTAGAVLTGGATMLAGTADLAERVLGMPVRVGAPKGVAGLVDVVNGPAYSTAVGLVLYGARHREEGWGVRVAGGEAIRNVTGKVKDWLAEFF